MKENMICSNFLSLRFSIFYQIFWFCNSSGLPGRPVYCSSCKNAYRGLKCFLHKMPILRCFWQKRGRLPPVSQHYYMKVYRGCVVKVPLIPNIGFCQRLDLTNYESPFNDFELHIYRQTDRHGEVNDAFLQDSIVNACNNKATSIAISELRVVLFF